MSNIPQIFKKRTDALRFVQSWRYPFKERTFYNFCDKHQLVEQDKTVKLCRLLAALWGEHPPITDSSDQAKADKRAIERDDADTRKAIAAADREEFKRDQEQREMGKTWIKREDADLQTCTWSALTRDSISGRLKKDVLAIIHAAGGQLDHSADVLAIIDQAITDGCNDIANSGEVDIDIEAIEGNE